MRAKRERGRSVHRISNGLEPSTPRAGSESTRIRRAATMMTPSTRRMAAVTNQNTAVDICTLRTSSDPWDTSYGT